MASYLPDYKPNSYRSKQESTKELERQIKKVAHGRKKEPTKIESHLNRILGSFINTDISSIYDDAIVPAIKKALWDIGTKGLDLIFYNGENPDKKRRNSNYISYDRFSDDREVNTSQRNTVNFNCEGIIFDSRKEVNAVLNQMESIIEKYGFVLVSDFYDMIDMTAPYTANRYGWTSVRNAEPVQTRDGYILKLPKAKPIDR